MNTTKIACQKRLRELGFIVAGDAALVKQIEDLKSRIEAHDFDALESIAIQDREKLLADAEVFPGATAKPVIPIDLPGGDTVRGKVCEYRHALIEFWTTAGIVEIPFVCLPEDLQACFREDPGIEATHKLRDLFKTVAEWKEKRDANFDNALDGLKDQMDIAFGKSNEVIADLVAISKAQKERIAELEAQLQQRDES